MKTAVALPEEDGKKPEQEKAIHIDFTKAGKKEPSPFQKAQAAKKRLKLFLWGDTGVGKSVTSLQFPRPVVIDMEGGTDLYGESFDFDVLKATTADEVMQAVDWLLNNPHEYRTLVIDPVTIYWEALQKKWSDIFLKRNKGSKGYKYEFYDLQPKDWMTLKAEFKSLVRKLLSLDMNVIVTAREKTKYKEGSFMVAIGETFDGEKSLPYMFDTIVRMYIDEKNRHMGTCLKDRSNRLPKEAFECTYEVFESYFGKKDLIRKAKPVELASKKQKETIRIHIGKFGMTPEQVSQRLAAYNAETLDDLTAENAEIIIGKFQDALKEREAQTTKEKENANA